MAEFRIYLGLSSLVNAKLFSKAIVLIYVSTAVGESSWSFTSFSSLSFVHLADVRWYFIVIFIFTVIERAKKSLV